MKFGKLYNYFVPEFELTRRPTDFINKQTGLDKNFFEKHFGRKQSDLLLPNFNKHENFWRIAQHQTGPTLMDKVVRSDTGKQYGPMIGGLIGNIWGPIGAAAGAGIGTKMTGAGGQTDAVRNAGIAGLMSYFTNGAKTSLPSMQGTPSAGGYPTYAAQQRSGDTYGQQAGIDALGRDDYLRDLERQQIISAIISRQNAAPDTPQGEDSEDAKRKKVAELMALRSLEGGPYTWGYGG